MTKVIFEQDFDLHSNAGVKAAELDGTQCWSENGLIDVTRFVAGCGKPTSIIQENPFAVWLISKMPKLMRHVSSRSFDNF